MLDLREPDTPITGFDPDNTNNMRRGTDFSSWKEAWGPRPSI